MVPNLEVSITVFIYNVTVKGEGTTICGSGPLYLKDCLYSLGYLLSIHCDLCNKHRSNSLILSLTEYVYRNVIFVLLILLDFKLLHITDKHNYTVKK